MRQIRMLVSLLMKVVFHLDTDDPSIKLIEDAETRKATDGLLHRIDSGEIREAELVLFERITDRSKDNLLAGIVFYSYLNAMEDDILEANAFSRNAVADGMNRLLSEYGLESMTDLFLQ